MCSASDPDNTDSQDSDQKIGKYEILCQKQITDMSNVLAKSR